MKADYVINPVMMGGLVKKVAGDIVKIHLHGRLGVICVPSKFIRYSEKLEPGHKLEFYFSYIQVVKDVLDYDDNAMYSEEELTPCLLGGKITEVNDTAIKVKVMDDIGTIAVPRRWVFTPAPLKEGQDVEFYFSCMNVVGKEDLPAAFI